MVKPVFFFIGPPGSGKTTQSQRFYYHLIAQGKVGFLINLDCGTENVYNSVRYTISDYISWEEVKSDLHLGPNAGILFSLEYLENNLQWIEKKILFKSGQKNIDFLIIDLPGQMEIFSHYQILRNIISRFNEVDYNSFCVLLNDFCSFRDPTVTLNFVFVSGSIYWNLKVPIVYFLTKCDLMEKKDSFKKLSDSIFHTPKEFESFKWVKKILHQLSYFPGNIERASPRLLDADESKCFNHILRLVENN